MKLNLTRTALALAASVVLFSCTKTDAEAPTGGGDDRVAAVIHAGIGSSAVTRAHDAEWDENDAIGLAMLIKGGTDIINDVYNYHYVTAARLGVFEPHSSEMMIYFPQEENLEVNFRAYYPYYPSLDEDMLIPVDVSNQTKLPDIDLMSAEHLTGFSKRDPTVMLHFYHRLTKLIFKLSEDNEQTMGNLEDCTITIHGMNTTGTYHLKEEELEENGASERDLTFPMRGNPAERYGIVLPRAAGEGVTFDFTFPDGSNYRAAMSENLELRPGYQYTFHVNLKQTPATITADIEDWIDGPERWYDAVQATVDAGENENVDPGTVMDVFLSGNNQDFTALSSYTYEDNDTWTPSPEVFWEAIPYDPSYMRASIAMEAPLNTTQLGDWLTTDGSVTVPRNSGAHFSLSRCVSKVFVQLISDQFTDEELAGAVVTLPDYYVGGRLEAGAFVPGTERDDIRAAYDTDNEQYVAIFQPQPVSQNGTVVEVEINGRTYEVEAADGAIEYEPGVAYSLIVRLHKAGLSVSASVVPWTEGPIYSFGAVQVNTPAGASNGVTAGDVLELYMGAGGAYDLLTSFVYKADGTWAAASPRYWEDIAANPASFIGRIDAADPLHPSQLPDVLLSEPTDGYSNTGIDLVLNHAAAKALVRLESGTFSDAQLRAATITLPGYTTGGTFTGAALVPGTSTGNITVVRGEDPDTGVAIFEPQTIPAGRTAVRVTIAGKAYDAPAPEGGIRFEEGLATTLIVTVEKEGIAISVGVTDWDKNEITLDTVKITAEVDGTEGVNPGEVMNVYTGSNRQPLTNFTWTGTQWTPSRNIYWEDLPTTETFYAEIVRQAPYGPNQPEDRLVSGPVTVNSGQGINFRLSHAVAQVAVRLTSDGTWSDEELKAMTVTLPGYRVGGTYDNGVFVHGTSNADIAVPTNVGADNESALAFLQPQTVTAGQTVVSVGYGTRTFAATYSADVVYRAGQITVLEIDLSKNLIGLSARVIDWITDPAITMVPDAIVISGDPGTTSSELDGKTMYVYNLTDGNERLPYTYQNNAWTGPKLYWDDYYTSGLSLTAVYFPYNTTTVPPDGTARFDWNLPADQKDGWQGLDLMMSHQEKQPGVYSNFNFALSHVLSRVEVNLDSDELPATAFAGAKVTLNGFRLGGYADIASGAIVASSATTATLNPYEDVAGRQFSAVVMPQNFEVNSPLVTVTLPAYPQRTFIGRVDRALSFTPGHITVINVKISLEEIQLNATLEEWVYNGSGNVTIE